MRESKLFVAAGIFIVLTLFKIIMPDIVLGMREGLVTQIDKSIDYKAVVTVLSHHIDDYSEYFAPDWPKASAVPKNSPEIQPKVSPTPTVSQAPVAVPTPIPTVSAQPSPSASFEPPANEAAGEQALPFDTVEPLAISVSSSFGTRLHPIDMVEKFHYGIDLSANEGDTIAAFADGEVIAAEYNDSYGNYIVVKHDESYSSLYAHCSELLVSVGEQVSAGQQIARVGHTGNATGPHLHFELRENGECIDPGEFLC